MTQQLHFWVYTQNWSKDLKGPLFTHAHSSIIHSGRKAEATHVPIDQWMG